MIPLKEAIGNGLWLKATVNGLIFQIRPLSLTKVDIANEVDEPLELENIDLTSNLWLMNLDVVNLYREKQDADEFYNHLILIDSDQFEFPVLYDFHLYNGSKYAKKSRLEYFINSGFPPKIKKNGTLAFELPDHFDELFIGFKDGSIMEA